MEEKVTDLDKLIESNAKSMSEKIMQDTQNKIGTLQSAMESNEKKLEICVEEQTKMMDDWKTFLESELESEERAFGHVIRPPK